MTPWLAAVFGLLPALAAALFFACRGTIATRFVAVQLATALSVGLLMLVTFAFDQSAFTDLALVLAVLSLPGTLLMALFLERWL